MDRTAGHGAGSLSSTPWLQVWLEADCHRFLSSHLLLWFTAGHPQDPFSGVSQGHCQVTTQLPHSLGESGVPKV
jgi:hypothetical protein